MAMRPSPPSRPPAWPCLQEGAASTTGSALSGTFPNARAHCVLPPRAGHLPDYACLIVGANMGIVGMCKEHMGVALALKVRGRWSGLAACHFPALVFASLSSLRSACCLELKVRSNQRLRGLALVREANLLSPLTRVELGHILTVACCAPPPVLPDCLHPSSPPINQHQVPVFFVITKVDICPGGCRV